jgi:hypothetical protein
MNGFGIAGVVIGAIVAVGLVFNARDLIRYLRISSM